MARVRKARSGNKRRNTTEAIKQIKQKYEDWRFQVGIIQEKRRRYAGVGTRTFAKGSVKKLSRKTDPQTNTQIIKDLSEKHNIHIIYTPIKKRYNKQQINRQILKTDFDNKDSVVRLANGYRSAIRQYMAKGLHGRKKDGSRSGINTGQLYRNIGIIVKYKNKEVYRDVTR